MKENMKTQLAGPHRQLQTTRQLILYIKGVIVKRICVQWRARVQVWRISKGVGV